MDISANVLAQIRKNCAPEMSYIQEEISKFAAKNGGKMRRDFWAVFNSVYSCTQDVMVCVQPDGKMRILEVRCNRTFARHVGELLKTCKVLRVFSDFSVVVDWNNWKSVYRSLTKAMDAQVYDYEASAFENERREVERKREEMFYEQATSDRYKKMGKRGYNLSFNEMRAVRRMEAMERQQYRILKTASKIMEEI